MTGAFDRFNAEVARMRIAEQTALEESASAEARRALQDRGEEYRQAQQRERLTVLLGAVGSALARAGVPKSSIQHQNYGRFSFLKPNIPVLEAWEIGFDDHVTYTGMGEDIAHHHYKGWMMPSPGKLIEFAVNDGRRIPRDDGAVDYTTGYTDSESRRAVAWAADPGMINEAEVTSALAATTVKYNLDVRM